MTKTLRRLTIAAALVGGMGLVAAAPAAAHSHATLAQTTVTAPTNLQVTALTRTSVTFHWDHSQGATPGCTLQLILYSVFVNGRFHGWTYLGSPVAHVANLRPGTTYRLAVQGRDNCSGVTSPLSEPLIVTTPR